MAGPRGITVAIDGVVGSGKSATARAVAAALGYRHIDTGAMYRAVTLAAVDASIRADNGPGLEGLLEKMRIELVPAAEGAGGGVLLNGVDVTDEIRSPQVSRAVGAYADVTAVRRTLVALQQAMGAEGGVVADGRDVGAVIFPDADLKIHMTADLEERTRRRHTELRSKGVEIAETQVREDIVARDRQDQERDYGAEVDRREVVILDTTDLTLDAQIERVIALARERGG